MKYNDNGTVKNIVVKAGDTLPIGTIVDYDGDTIPDGYEEVEDYSLNEVKVGTWMGKPLYRRVFETGILTTSEVTVANIPNIQVKMIHGWLFKDDGTIQNYGHYMNSEGTYTSRVFYSANVIKVQQGTSFQNKDYKARIVVEYTKTAD